MGFHIRKMLNDIVKHRHILNDYAVCSDFIQKGKLLSHFAEFVLKDDGIHGDVHFHLSEMGVIHSLRQG